MTVKLKNKLINLIIFTAVIIETVVFCFPLLTAYGNSVILTVTALNKTYTFTDIETAIYNGSKTLKNLNEVIDGIYLDTLKKPTDASIDFTPQKSQKFTVKSGQNGVEIDKELLKNDIITALNLGYKTVNAKSMVLKPNITSNELKSYTNLRSRFTTYYPNSTVERKHNISLASSFINGTVIDNNEEFSFNNVVGERALSRGFKNAKIIVNGEYTEGVGGGVCQVSTTLYNAVILSGLKVSEKHPHSLQVSYVEPSFDAMVSYPVCDLKFINQTGGKIFLAVYAEDDYISIEVYGKKQVERYERVSVVTDTINPTNPEIIENEELFIGEKRVIQPSKQGVKSEGYLITYLNNERVKTVKLRVDEYKSVRGKIEVGIKPTSESGKLNEI